jgi:hypothetical protein
MNRMATMVFAVSLLAGSASESAAQDPLTLRVTIDYRNAAAADVIGALGRAAGLPVEISPGVLRPVTITLTNVRPNTALNAVCENASCTWRLQNGLKVTPVAADRAATLPASVSIDLRDTPATEIFRGLATALNVPITLDLDPSGGLLSIRFKDAPTATVLDTLCQIQSQPCTWTFDAATGLRVTRQRQGGR